MFIWGGNWRVRKKLHRSCFPCEILLGLSWVGDGVGESILILKKLPEVLVCLFSGQTKLNENKLMILSKSPNFVNGTWKEPWLGPLSCFLAQSNYYSCHLTMNKITELWTKIMAWSVSKGFLNPKWATQHQSERCNRPTCSLQYVEQLLLKQEWISDF